MLLPRLYEPVVEHRQVPEDLASSRRTKGCYLCGENNVELVVKVLDGRAVNGHFWVFYGALSNVEYTILVRDTTTGQERTYHNPAGQLASRADTAAF